jgi:hypothetical protein
LKDVTIGGVTVCQMQAEVGVGELDLAALKLVPCLLGQPAEAFPDLHLDSISI